MGTERKFFWLLLAILIIAIFFRFFSIKATPPGLYSDEAVNGNNAITALESKTFKVFYPENNGREGLFINIQALFLKGAELVGLPVAENYWLLRLPSAIFGTLTVLGVYFLTKELFGKPAALIAAFLIATSFWHINFSRIGFRAIMAPAFLTWAIYFLLLSFRKLKTTPLISYFLPLPILGGLIYGFGFHSYIAYRATPLIILIILFFYWRISKRENWQRQFLISIFYFLFFALIIFLPLGFYFLENPADFFGRTTQISIWHSPTPLKDLGLNILKTAGMFNFAGDWNPRHNLPGKPLLSLLVGIIFLIGLGLGIKNLFKQSTLGFKIFLTWLFIAALPVVISNEGVPHALRSILMAPPVFVLAAVGGLWLYEKLLKIGFPKRFLVIISYLFFLLLIAESYRNYFIVWAQKTEVRDAFDQKAVIISRELNRLPPAMPKYVILDIGGADIREIGSPAQTVMYITNSYAPEKQKEKNISYIAPAEKPALPLDAFVVEL